MAGSDTTEPREGISSPPTRELDADGGGTPPEPGRAQQSVEADLLVEDVSIDGMCGVY